MNRKQHNDNSITMDAARFDRLWISLREDDLGAAPPQLLDGADADEPDYETEAARGELEAATADRVAHLNALVSARLQGAAVLFGFLQDAARPAWVRVRAVRELAKLERDSVTSPYYALLEHIQTANGAAAGLGGNEAAAWLSPDGASGALPGVGTARFEAAAGRATINGLQNDGVDHPLLAEASAEAKDTGYALGVDIKEPVEENTLLHVMLFDRENGETLKHAAAPVERRDQTLYHADLFERETLSRSEIEHADALFWIEKPKAKEREAGQ